jgi:plasmid stabilization system protein ParE
LRPVAPAAAARVIDQLAQAPNRLRDYPRIGEKLEAYEPREVRRIIVGRYDAL